MKYLWDYDIRILLAMEQAISGKKEFFNFLIENGYPEIAAFASAIRQTKMHINGY